MLARGRRAATMARALNPGDNEVNLLTGNLELQTARTLQGAARLAALREAQRTVALALQQNARPLHGWILLGEIHRRQAELQKGAPQSEAIAAAEAALGTAEGIVMDHPRVHAERASLQLLWATTKPLRDEGKAKLEAAIARNPHLRWRYAAGLR